jgi:hypothetical protein
MRIIEYMEYFIVDPYVGNQKPGKKLWNAQKGSSDPSGVRHTMTKGQLGRISYVYSLLFRSHDSQIRRDAAIGIVQHTQYR